jgi:glycerol-1-phosphate dehydrogenase [NAD(P)+]
MFSHSLETIIPNCSMHGERCGVGAIMMAYLHKANWSLVKATLQKLGAPTNARELGVSKEQIVRALELAPSLRPERYTILNKLNLNRQAYERVAEATGVL